jgi:ubiquinone/menaquinone biosynthesis C-methylase UbiE
VTENSIGPGLSTGNPQNVAYRLDKVASLIPIGGSWLDCGGFDGQYAKGILERGAERVTISDVDGTRVDEANALWSRDSRFEFATCPAEEMPFATDSFDGVLLNEVLEHVRDERETLDEVSRVLKPGGTLVLFSPNRWFPFEGHGLEVRGKRFNMPAPLIPWLPKRLTQGVVKARNYWPRDLRHLVEGSAFESIRTDFALPTLNTYPWLPARLVNVYQENLDRLDRSPLRRFGVSSLVIGRKA